MGQQASFWGRVGVVAAAVVGWYLLRGQLGALSWGTPQGAWVGWTGMALWAAVLLALLVVVSKSKRTGPEARMAVGCLWMVIGAVAVVVGVLGLALGMRWVWVVNGISFWGMGLAALVVPQLVWAGVKTKRRR